LITLLIIISRKPDASIMESNQMNHPNAMKFPMAKGPVN